MQVSRYIRREVASGDSLSKFENQVKGKLVYAVLIPSPTENGKTSKGSDVFTAAELSSATLILKDNQKTVAEIPVPVINAATDNHGKFVLNIDTDLDWANSSLTFGDTTGITTEAIDITFEYFE